MGTFVSLIKVYKVGGVAEDIGQLQTTVRDEHPLAGVGTKLERAREHLVMLNGEVSAFLERNPYEIFKERRRGGRELVFRVRARERPPSRGAPSLGTACRTCEPPWSISLGSLPV